MKQESEAEKFTRLMSEAMQPKKPSIGERLGRVIGWMLVIAAVPLALLGIAVVMKLGITYLIN